MMPGSKNLFKGHGHRTTGVTLMEVLIVFTLFGLVSTTIYRFFQHYATSYVKIDDKLENIAEGWQILRMLKDDLSTCECPNGDVNLWRETVKTLGKDGYEIVRRCDDKFGTVIYNFDGKKGDISRDERLPDKPPRSASLLRNRCSVFRISVVTEPPEIQPKKKPTKIYFRVHLELGNVTKSKETLAPLVIDTNIFPVFLNQNLNHRYIHQGLPN